VREPDLAGIAKAWKIKMTQEMIDAHIKEWGYPHTGIATWYVNGPDHPFWNWWLISVISLKDILGVPPAQKKYPEAEYEYTCYSLKGTPNIDAIDKGDYDNRGFENILEPSDVQFHFHGVTDKQAEEICDAAVFAIVQGQSCDSDFRNWWEQMLINTVTHYKLGVHE
jgi:hypothetical protein